MRLNIGAGETYVPGFVNIDIAPHAELTLDLNKDKLPFQDNSVDLVFSYHTLEHVQNYVFALSEIHRVLKHNGRLLVGLPYVSLTYHHQVNPYHLQNFNEAAFDFFDPKKLRGSAVEQAVEEHAILFERGFHRYHYMDGFQLVPPPARGWCRKHLLNTVRKIDLGLVAIKDDAQPIVVDPRALRAEFGAINRSRRRYEPRPPKPLLARLCGRLVAKWRGH